MPGNRITRINEGILRELTGLMRELKDPRLGQGLVSITRVEATQDLKFAKVYLSVYGEVDQKEMRKGLRSSAGFLRRELAHRLDFRTVPELTFVLDDSITHGAKILGMIEELNHSEDRTDG